MCTWVLRRMLGPSDDDDLTGKGAGLGRAVFSNTTPPLQGSIKLTVKLDSYLTFACPCTAEPGAVLGALEHLARSIAAMTMR